MAEYETSASVAEVDAMVRAAVGLCKRAEENLPERSTLQTLLRFAQGTDSVQEALLFMRYQASRETHKKYAGFLEELASVVEKDYAGNIDATRRFLGILVRAGTVELARRNEHPRRKQSRGWQQQEGESRGHRR